MPFEIVRNDITQMNVDAIVNAANRSLLGGGGVDGAIHMAAGPELLAECRQLNGCETGEAKITKGYRLPARYVIHTVGPVWYGGNHHERELLAACYRNSLQLAAEYGCESVAFPMISAGAYGYPKDQAMEVAVEEISRFLLAHDMMVWLVVFGRTELFTGKKLFRDVVEYIDDHYVDTHAQQNSENIRKRLWQRNEEKALALEARIREKQPADDASFDMPMPTASMPAFARKMGGKGRPDWAKMVDETDEGFSRALLRLIDEKDMTDVQCYKRANVDKRLFSKIRSDPDYRPGKTTVLAFAVALELTLKETKELLEKAGFALSRSSKLDVVVEYCIREGIHDIIEINEVLYELDLPLLGNHGKVA